MTDVRTLPSTSNRVDWIDRLRGLALVLMVLDHVLVQIDPSNPLRYTLTRLSLPLFMAASAAVWTPDIRTRRLVLLASAATVELVASSYLGMPFPGIMLVYLVAVVPLSLWHEASSSAYWVAALGLIQALYLPVGWLGYEPGLVLAWWGLGRLGSYQLDRLGSRLPRCLASVGRWPAQLYAFHLLVLVALVAGGVL